MASFAGRRRSLLLSFAFAALAGPAFGQAAPGARWVLETDILGGYQSRMSDVASPREGFSTRLAARLGYRFRLQRVRLRASAGMGATVYPRQTEYNRFTWNAGLVATSHVSPRTSADAQVKGSLGYGWSYAGAVEEVAIPPDALRRTGSVGASVEHRLSRTLDGRVEVSGVRYDFGSSLRLPDGWRVGARAGLLRSTSKDSVRSAFVELERTSTHGQEFQIQRLLVAWRHPLVRGLVVGLVGGLAHYRPIDSGSLPAPPDQATGTDPGVTPTGGAEVNWRFGDHALSARLARTVGQTFGLGAVGVSRVFMVGYNVNLGPRLDFTAAANDLAFLEGVAVGATQPRVRGFRAGFRYALTRRLDAHVDYSYWRRGEDLVATDRHAVWAGVRRDFAWR